jgi:dTDP-4-dehydrorhamnose reductase
LILGAGGQLGQALVAAAPAGATVIPAARQQADLLVPGAVASLIAATEPEVVINAAAYTAVDRAESEPDLAHRINRDAVAEAAHACRDVGARLYHVSTDYVFDGTSSRPYRTSDPTRPINVYGMSKAAGEGALAACEGLNWAVFRTAWVYAAYGRNFMLTMLRLFREKGGANVVDDQFGAPTHARSLARVLWRAAADPGVTGLWHYTDAGSASWYDFAEAIREEAAARGLVPNTVRVAPVPSAAFPTPARRPAFSVLDRQDTWAWLGDAPRHWRAELRLALEELSQ